MTKRRKHAPRPERKPVTRSKPAPALPLARSTILVLASLSVIAMLVCAYLTYAYHRLTYHVAWQNPFAGALTSKCDTLLLRPYASIGVAPLSAFGAIYYAFTAASLVKLARGNTRPARSPSLFALVWSGFALVVSITMSIVSLIDQHALCSALALIDLANGASVTLAFITTTKWTESEWGETLERELGTWQGWALVVPTLLVAAAFVLYAYGPLAMPRFCESLLRAVRRSTPSKPAELVVYSEPRCEPCRRVNAALRSSAFGFRNLHVIRRQYPLDPACNPKANRSDRAGGCLLARAAICGQALGRHEELSARLEDARSVAPEALTQLAVETGIDRKQFSECLSSAKTESVLREHIEAGNRDGIRGTPAFVLDGQTFVGVDDDMDSCVR